MDHSIRDHSFHIGTNLFVDYCYKDSCMYFDSRAEVLGCCVALVLAHNRFARHSTKYYEINLLLQIFDCHGHLHMLHLFSVEVSLKIYLKKYQKMIVASMFSQKLSLNSANN
jgi:hypothetical protein